MSADAKKFLEQLLQSGKDLVGQGKAAAEKGLGIPSDGPEREKTIATLGKGAALGGVLALLLGTRSGRRISGGALKLGSLAALGTVAYRAYKHWSSGQGGASEPSPKKFISESPPAEVEARSARLVRAMIAATKADGHVDAQERQRIESQIQQLGLDQAALGLLRAELDRPLDPRELAQGVGSPEEAAEIYLASYLVLDVDHVDERTYLDRLAESLGIHRELARKIEFEAAT